MNENSPMEMYYANAGGYPYNTMNDSCYVGLYDNHPTHHPPMNYGYHHPPHPPAVPVYGQEPAYWSMNMYPYRSYYSEVESTSYYGYGINNPLPRIDTNQQNAWECSSSTHIEQPTMDTQSEENIATNSNDSEECLVNNEEASSPEDVWQDDIDPDNMTYEELLDLGEAVGTQSRGLSKELIKLLPTSRYKAGGLFSKKRDKESCIICLMSYKIGDRQIRLPCKHVYHSKCGKKWLSINKACPVCNSEVFADEPRN